MGLPPLRLFLHILSLAAVAAATERTIDDTLGDSVTHVVPAYAPAQGVWQDRSCTGCAIQPDPTQVQDGTWMATTYNAGLKLVSIEVPFTGTAITVYFVLANTLSDSGITSLTECDFRLDGAIVASYSHVSDGSGVMQYNVPVFSSGTLSNADHTLSIDVTGDHDVWICFDYAKYEFQDVVQPPAPPPSSKQSSEPTSIKSSSSSPTPQLPPSSSSTIGSTASQPTHSSVSASQTDHPSPSAPNNGASAIPPLPAITPSSSSDLPGDAVLASKSPSHAGPIAGGVVGGLATIAVLAALIIWLCRRRRRQLAPEPYPISITAQHGSSLPISLNTAVPTAYSPVATSPADTLSPGGRPALGKTARYLSSPVETTPSPTNALPAPHAPPANFSTLGAPAFSSGAARDRDRKVGMAELRQAGLERQMLQIRAELEGLRTARPAADPPEAHAAPAAPPEILQEMDLMRREIDRLQAARRGTWMTELPDEQPPGYSPQTHG